MTKRVTLIIHGIVQGMGYRYTSRNEAQKRNFTGYVQNTDDGTVLLVAEGEEKDLKAFITWCYNGVGPALVTAIEEQWSAPTGEFSDFMIRS